MPYVILRVVYSCGRQVPVVAGAGYLGHPIAARCPCGQFIVVRERGSGHYRPTSLLVFMLATLSHTVSRRCESRGTPQPFTEVAQRSSQMKSKQTVCKGCAKCELAFRGLSPQPIPTHVTLCKKRFLYIFEEMGKSRENRSVHVNCTSRPEKKYQTLHFKFQRNSKFAK